MILHSFAEHLRDIHHVAPVLRNAVQSGALRLERTAEGDPIFHFDGRKMKNEKYALALNRVLSFSGGEVAAGIDVYCAGSMLAEGPKIFRPTLEECLAFEEVEVNLHVRDYAQPFDTFVIELPAEYTNLRKVQGLVRASLYSQESINERYGPVAQIVRVERPSGMVAVLTITSVKGMTVSGIVGSSEQATIEDDLGKMLIGETSGYTTAPELLMEKLTTRVSLNACLFLVDRGHRLSAQTNQSYIDRLKSRRERAEKRGDDEKAALAEKELSEVPLVYEFSQKINVRRYIGSSDACGGVVNGDRKVSPHWRRSHYRMQAHGEKRSKRKRILIEHCMVNEHLFGGDVADTKVEYGGKG